ncbi:Thiol-specific monooxygenase [Escovopsis weberi]|uniref:Thiol-specific monooxygenase n=1 Tax=Escovopsis weberi TaxID=150374 RepID=A0A0M9VUX3_ESCWE|nr:Thiol-specific monooxygenase [Escovopsis weberi]
MTVQNCHPAKKVAVIGAGISGIQAAAYLLRQGLQVVVFERSSEPGGIWVYSEEPSPEPVWPCTKASVGDYQPTKPGQASLRSSADTNGAANGAEFAYASDDEARRAFAPGSALWAGIMTNVPSCLMVSNLAPWPAGTKSLIPHAQVKTYVQALAADHGAHGVTEYNTRVEELRKAPGGDKWDVRTVTLQGAGCALLERTWQFDAVVVASGHNWRPRVPDVPGLAEWKRRFPGRLMHSMQYRRPEFARGKSVVVVGNGVSALNICEELVAVGAKSVVQAVRQPAELPAHIWPPSVRRVQGLERFELSEEGEESTLADGAPIPGSIHLHGGEVLEAGTVDHVIFTTGFLNSLPYLSHLHEDDTAPEDAGPRTLVTSDGSLTHNLHKDIFYIPDPTLAFIGLPSDSATFHVFDFQAQVVARVFAGKAELPSEAAMREEYAQLVRDKGLKKRSLHSLRAAGEIEYVQALVDWCNRDAERLGAEQIKGHSDEWKQQRQHFYNQVIALMKGEPGAVWPGSE